MQYDLNKLCNSIFNADDKIRFVGVINEMGQLIAGSMKKGLTSLERDDGALRLYLGYAINNALRRDFDHEFGKVFYTFSEREKIKLLSIPIDDDLLIISMERSSKHVILIDKILDIVRNLTKP